MTFWNAFFRTVSRYSVPKIQNVGLSYFMERLFENEKKKQQVVPYFMDWSHI